MNKVIPYQSGPKPETAGGVPDWMRFLDLLEEVAGYDGALELYEEYVVVSDDADPLVRWTPLIGSIVAAQLALCLVLLGLAVHLRQRRRRQQRAAVVAVSSETWPTDEASSSLSTP